MKTDVFFITLNKTDERYSPTTLYQDYAVSDTLFHWQSQNATSPESKVGQRYIHHAEQGVIILLFVRENDFVDNLACPFVFLGPATYESHTGSKPMSILWRLTYPIPARLLPVTRRLVPD